NIIAFARFVCVIVATQVGSNDGVAMPGEEWYLVTPGVPELGKAVQEDNQWPAALSDVVHANAVADDVAVLPGFLRNCHVDISPANRRKGFTAARNPPIHVIPHQCRCRRWRVSPV